MRPPSFLDQWYTKMKFFNALRELNATELALIAIVFVAPIAVGYSLLS